MKTICLVGLLVGWLLTPPTAISAPAIGQSAHWASLTNDDVLSLLKAGLSAAIVVAKIQSSDYRFDTSPDALVELRKQRVPDAVQPITAQA